MLTVAIPGREPLHLEHLVLDYNGTLACDGDLVDGVKDRLVALSKQLRIHVITADTFGTARSALKGAPCDLHLLPADNQDERKLRYVEQVGRAATVCIGNGLNDRRMVSQAALGIAVVLAEGAAVETLRSADIVCTDICSALDLLLKPRRLIATLRT
jgi:P-type E1-E2 ATPase